MTAQAEIEPVAYSGYAEWKTWDEAAFMAPPPVERDYYADELRGHPIAGKDVLEIGFGNGGFLAWAKDQGARLHGSEIQPELARRGVDAGVELVDPDLTRLLPERAGSFALVAAFDVLEHLDFATIRPLLESAAELLADGGLFVARFPNGQSPLGRVHQHADVTHRSILSAAIVAQLIQGLPFDPVHLGNPAPARGAVNAIRARIHRALEWAVQRLYGLDAPLAPNSVAVLRRQPRGGGR